MARALLLKRPSHDYFHPFCVELQLGPYNLTEISLPIDFVCEDICIFKFHPDADLWRRSGVRIPALSHGNERSTCNGTQCRIRQPTVSHSAKSGYLQYHTAWSQATRIVIQRRVRLTAVSHSVESGYPECHTVQSQNTRSITRRGVRLLAVSYSTESGYLQCQTAWSQATCSVKQRKARLSAVSYSAESG